MIKLIFKLIAVVLPTIIIAICFEVIALKIPTTYNAKLNYFNNVKDNIEILVLGSSHSNFGINPKHFEKKGFNFSNTSQCLLQDYQLLNKYLTACKKLKIVIVPVSYFSLYTDLDLTPEAWRTAYYSFYLGLRDNSFHSLLELKNHSGLFLWNGPLEVISALRNVKRMNINQFGYQEPNRGNAQAITIDAKSGKERVEYHHGIMRDELYEKNYRYLSNIAEYLNKKNVKMIIVVTPVFCTYYNNIDMVKYNVMLKSIHDVSEKYTTKYFNFFYDKRFLVDDFSDNDHLNQSGATKFSIILNDEVISPLLLGK